MKVCPVRAELRGYGVAAQGSGAAGKWDGRRAVGHRGASALRTFHPCHFLSITIDVGNAEEGGAAVSVATGVSECQNTAALGATFRLWTFNRGIVCNSHRRTLFQPVGVFF